MGAEKETGQSESVSIARISFSLDRSIKTQIEENLSQATRDQTESLLELLFGDIDKGDFISVLTRKA